MNHYLLHKPIDLSDEKVDIEYLTQQIAVATALNANPIILQHMQLQMEANAFDLLNYDAIKDEPDLAKSKMLTKQSATAATAYYLRLAHSQEYMVQRLRELTTNPNPQE